MENKIKSAFKKAGIVQDDRAKYLFQLLVKAFDEEVKVKNEEYLIEILSEGFVLENIYSQHVIDYDGIYTVKEYSETQGKGYKKIKNAIKAIQRKNEK